MSRIQHQRHDQRLHRIKRPQKHMYSHKFNRTRKNQQTHAHRIPNTEAGHPHINAIGHAEKQKPRKNGNRMGKRADKSFLQHLCSISHLLILSTVIISYSCVVQRLSQTQSDAHSCFIRYLSGKVKNGRPSSRLPFHTVCSL